jgi:CBS domain-containing protein
MNVAFFLVPKADVAWLKSTSPVRYALERMEYSGYTALPIVSPEGAYAGTLTEGDLLRFLRSMPGACPERLDPIRVEEVRRRLKIRPIRVDAQIEDLLTLALDQNFVPVVDDRDAFIGIVPRRKILLHFRDQLRRRTR